MAATPAGLRAAFPEFANESNYPDSMLLFWITFCGRMLDPQKLDDALDDATYLAAAHQAILARRAVIVSESGGTPGAVVAPQSAKSVDNVSASYDTKAVTIENVGHWAGTQYGLQFCQIIRVYGAGVCQL